MYAGGGFAKIQKESPRHSAADLKIISQHSETFVGTSYKIGGFPKSVFFLSSSILESEIRHFGGQVSIR